MFRNMLALVFKTPGIQFYTGGFPVEANMNDVAKTPANLGVAPPMEELKDDNGDWDQAKIKEACKDIEVNQGFIYQTLLHTFLLWYSEEIYIEYMAWLPLAVLGLKVAAEILKKDNYNWAISDAWYLIVAMRSYIFVGSNEEWQWQRKEVEDLDLTNETMSEILYHTLQLAGRASVRDQAQVKMVLANVPGQWRERA